MKKGDRVVITTRNTPEEKGTHFIPVGKVCTVLEVQEDLLIVEYDMGKGILTQRVYPYQVAPCEVKTN